MFDGSFEPAFAALDDGFAPGLTASRTSTTSDTRGHDQPCLALHCTTNPEGRASEREQILHLRQAKFLMLSIAEGSVKRTKSNSLKLPFDAFDTARCGLSAKAHTTWTHSDGPPSLLLVDAPSLSPARDFSPPKLLESTAM